MRSGQGLWCNPKLLKDEVEACENQLWQVLSDEEAATGTVQEQERLEGWVWFGLVHWDGTVVLGHLLRGGDTPCC